MEIILLIVLVCGAFIALSQRGQKSPSQETNNTDRSQVKQFIRPNVKKRSVAQAQEQSYPAIPSSMRLIGKAYVIDGDTIKIKGTKIRLAGIDAPELNMPWGQKSKWTMVEICKGQIITAELDGERSHDRLVGTCFLSDGRDIGAEIIKRGLALDLSHFSGGKYRQFEPEGARRKLCNGKFGHASIRIIQHTEVRIRTNQK